MYGAAMLTDMGIGASIVQKDHGDSATFLNTAWTVQILRSLLIFVGICALAIPLAKLYSEPLIAAMLPVVGFSGIISGFNSTKLYTAQRNLEAARVTQIEIGTYALGLLCTILLAWLLQSVWALVWGSVITSFLKMSSSHIFLHGIRNKFEWNRDALDQLIVFGRWIMLNSFLTFLSAEGSRLLLGALLDMRQLALYTLASTMSLMLWQAILQLAWRVFFPAYSEVYRGNPKNLMSVLFKSRLAIILPSWLLAVIFVFFGDLIMETLYDARYHGSGAMLELLAAGTLVSCVWGSYVGILLAVGKVATSTMLIAIQIVCQIAAMLFGYHYWGGAGIVLGVAAANWLMYPVNAFVMSKNGLLQPKLDLMMLSASVVIVMLAWPHFTAIGYGLD
jgi:O-antigen/teichoic acid export membrane protein